MTTEEAIQILKQYLDMDSEVKSEYLEAQRMAIKVLEQQPCEDCISREAVIKHLENITMDTNPDHYDSKDKWYQANGFNVCKVGIEMYVKNLLSITPKGVTITDFADRCKECGKQKVGKWIPVSERLPEREGWYLTSLGDKTYGGADVDMYCKGWVKYGTHVLAWMPLPEPYNIPAQTFGCAED